MSVPEQVWTTVRQELTELIDEWIDAAVQSDEEWWSYIGGAGPSIGSHMAETALQLLKAVAEANEYSEHNDDDEVR